jgi:hypothetical protein
MTSSVSVERHRSQGTVSKDHRVRAAGGNRVATDRASRPAAKPVRAEPNGEPFGHRRSLTEAQDEARLAAMMADTGRACGATILASEAQVRRRPI